VEAAAASAGAPTAGAAATSPLSADGEARLAALSARLDAVEGAIARPTATGVPPAAPASDARGLALAALRRAVDSGRPFTAELDMLAAFGPDAITNGLRQYAASGVASRDALRADFGRVADAILAVSATPDDSLFGRIVASARGLVSVRPTTPVAGTDPPAVVSRIEAAVAQGDLATALREREALPVTGKDASAAWAARAQGRLTADGLLAEPAALTGAVNR
jgi:hypothetical protein